MMYRGSFNKRSVGSIAIVALLLTGIFAVVPNLTSRASAQTSTTVTTSADNNGSKFFGPAFLEVMIFVPGHGGESTAGSQAVTVNAFGASQTYQVPETAATSGQFLMYIKVDPNAATAKNPLAPAQPFSSTFTKLLITPTPSGSTAAGYGTVSVLNAQAGNINRGGSIQISANGVTKTVTWDHSNAALTLDRTAYGQSSIIIPDLKAPDANLDPTKADTITETIPNTMLASGGDSPSTVVVWTETGPNTGVFEITSVNGVAVSGLTIGTLGGADSASRSLSANDYMAFNEGTNGGTVTPNVAAANYPSVLTGSQGTSSASYTVQNVKGAIQPPGTITYSTGLPLQISDLDENISSRSQEFLTGKLQIILTNQAAASLGGSSNPLVYNLKENGLNNSTFVPAYSNNKIKIVPGNLASITAADQTNGILHAQPGSDIIVNYLDPSRANAITSTITFQLVDTPPTLKVDKTTASRGSILTYTLTDPSLNIDSTIVDSYTVTFTGTTAYTSNTAPKVTLNGAPLFDVRLRVSGATKTMTTPLTMTFIETDVNTGVFKATLDMNTLATNIGGGFSFVDGDNLDLTIKDVFDQTQSVFPEVTATTNLGLTKPDVSIDRTTSGVPRNPAIGAVTDLGQSVDGTASNLGPQIFHITVSDPSAVTNAQLQETLIPTLGATATSANGVLILDSTGAVAGPNGKLRLSLLDSNGNPFTSAGSIAISKAIRETGFGTGIFTGEITVNFNPNDTPAQWIGSKLKIEYAGLDNIFGTSDDGNTNSIGFTARNAVLTTDTTTVTNGGNMTITVRDDDSNRDATSAEQVKAVIQWVSGGSTVSGIDTLSETGVNTGIFTKTLKIGTSTWGGSTLRVDPDTDFKIRYYDLTPSIAGSTSWPSASNTNAQVDLTLRTSTFAGGLTLAPEKVGPATQIKVSVFDQGQVLNPNTKETLFSKVTAVSDRGAASRADVNVDETGPGTGLFTGKVRLNPAQAAGSSNSGTNDVTINALPGDLVSIRYTQDKGLNGQRTTVTKTVQVTSWDPVMNFTKSAYKVGDTLELTIVDPDANRDPDTADILTIHAWSTTDSVGLTNVQAIETGANTGVFKALIPTSSSFSTGVLQVSNGDDVTVQYEDAFPANFRAKFDSNGTLAGSTQKFNVHTTIGVGGTTGSTTPSKPALADITGGAINEVTAGQQVVLTTNIKNNDNQARPYVAIVEVRNADGITVMLQWQQGTMAANGNAGVGISWTPDVAGSYQVRTFVISNLSNPQVLSNVVTNNVTVS
jgi:hypothetical protein